MSKSRIVAASLPEVWPLLDGTLTDICGGPSWLCVTRVKPSRLPREFRNRSLGTEKTNTNYSVLKCTEGNFKFDGLQWAQ